MLCWSVTAYTGATTDEPLIITGAETTYTHAHRAAGDAALAALGHLAGHRPGATMFVSITIDGTPLLIAAASPDHHRGTTAYAALNAAAAHVRDTGTTYTPTPAP